MCNNDLHIVNNNSWESCHIRNDQSYFVNIWEIRHKLQNKKQCHSSGQGLKTSPAVCVKSSREWTVGAPAGYCWGASFLPIWQQDHNHQTQYPHRPTTTHSTHTVPTTSHTTHNHNLSHQCTKAPDLPTHPSPDWHIHLCTNNGFWLWPNVLDYWYVTL